MGGITRGPALREGDQDMGPLNQIVNGWGLPQRGVGQNISGHAAPGGYKIPEKGGGRELLSANAQQVAALAGKGMGGGGTTSIPHRSVALPLPRIQPRRVAGLGTPCLTESQTVVVRLLGGLLGETEVQKG